MRPVTSVSPDWCLRGVRPKCAPTLREDRKRAGSSMADAKVSATIAPTPGVVISRRVGSLLRASAERCQATPSLTSYGDGQIYEGHDDRPIRARGPEESARARV